MSRSETNTETHRSLVIRSFLIDLKNVAILRLSHRFATLWNDFSSEYPGGLAIRTGNVPESLRFAVCFCMKQVEKLS
jgi:hypothetical protein